MSESIVMTSFNRPVLLDTTLQSIRHQRQDIEIVVVNDGTDELTEGVCQKYDAKHVKLNRPQSSSYRNQARPLNVGIRHATGDVIILQNAECKHIAENVIQDLVSRVTEYNVPFARVLALFPDGNVDMVYCGTENPRPFFFCGAIHRSWFEKLRGFDEDYQGYGYEDDDFADRLTREGVKFEYTDIEVHHQWHPQAGAYDMSVQAQLFTQKRNEGTVRNLHREWGAI